jgi:Fe2+ or Zn2+ uptake regulation protein
LSDIQHFNDLRKKGYRLTPQRLIILKTLQEAGGHLTAQEIFERAAGRMPGLTEPTVYRTLEFLTRNGLALVAYIGDGRLVYETAAHNHHHLICRDCGHSVEVSHAQLTALFETFHEQTGFIIDGGHVTFFGTCPGCQQDGSSDQGKGE